VFGERHQLAAPSVHPGPDGSVLVRADTPIRDVNRQLDLDLPEGDDWSTVGGLCMFLADGVPRQGDVLRSADGTELHIETASERAVDVVRLIPRAVAGEAESRATPGPRPKS
jgi:putative hemolysin